MAESFSQRKIDGEKKDEEGTSFINQPKYPNMM